MQPFIFRLVLAGIVAGFFIAAIIWQNRQDKMHKAKMDKFYGL